MRDQKKAAVHEQMELNDSLREYIVKTDTLFDLTLQISEKNERIQRIFNDKLIRALKDDVFDIQRD